MSLYSKDGFGKQGKNPNFKNSISSLLETALIRISWLLMKPADQDPHFLSTTCKLLINYSVFLEKNMTMHSCVTFPRSTVGSKTDS